jgi:CCR4-NOT transcription complex subunit 2
MVLPLFDGMNAPRLRLTQLTSEFPSLLSNNQSQPSSSTWAASGARGMGQTGNLRQQQQPPGPASQQQDDLFGSSSQLLNQGSFRFGGQAVGQSSQATSVDEVPPLNRNTNGDIGQDRATSMMHNAGYAAQSNGLGFGAGNASQPQTNRSNGLLNALSGSNRATTGNRVSSPGSISGGLQMLQSSRGFSADKFPLGLTTTRSPVDGPRQASAIENEPVVC